MEDFDGWEVLPDDGFLQIHDDGGKRIFSRNYGAGRCVFKDYFICPDSNSTKSVETTEQEEDELYSRSRVIPVALIQLEDSVDNHVDFKKITEIPFEKTIHPSHLLRLENLKVTADPDPDPDPVSQVLFKKMKEPEFVDMKKLESPTRSMKPPPFQVDAAIPAFQIVDGKGEAFDMKISSPRCSMEGARENIINGSCWEEHNSAPGNNGGFNIWKWSLTGIGAICSFGIATATVCIIFYGAHQRNSKSKQQYEEKHKLQFHIYSDEKRTKESVPAMRGSASAHITYGGYYDLAL